MRFLLGTPPTPGPVTSWFTENKDTISGIAGMATTIGLLATSIALVVATTQLRRQRQLSKAQAIYEIQRDARDASWRLASDDVLYQSVSGKPADKAGVAIGTSINFYAAAFQMWQHGVMEKELWNLLARELVGMLELQKPKQRWSDAKELYDSRFVKDIDDRVAAVAAENAKRAAAEKAAAEKAENEESS